MPDIRSDLGDHIPVLPDGCAALDQVLERDSTPTSEDPAAVRRSLFELATAS
jgi:hypothetical protein